MENKDEIIINNTMKKPNIKNLRQKLKRKNRKKR